MPVLVERTDEAKLNQKFSLSASNIPFPIPILEVTEEVKNEWNTQNPDSFPTPTELEGEQLWTGGVADKSLRCGKGWGRQMYLKC